MLQMLLDQVLLVLEIHQRNISSEFIVKYAHSFVAQPYNICRLRVEAHGIESHQSILIHAQAHLFDALSKVRNAGHGAEHLDASVVGFSYAPFLKMSRGKGVVGRALNVTIDQSKRPSFEFVVDVPSRFRVFVLVNRNAVFVAVVNLLDELRW